MIRQDSPFLNYAFVSIVAASSLVIDLTYRCQWGPALVLYHMWMDQTLGQLLVLLVQVRKQL